MGQSSLTQSRYHKKHQDPSHSDKRYVAALESISRQSPSVHFYDRFSIARFDCVLTSWKHLRGHLNTINGRHQAEELTSNEAASFPVRCGVAPGDPRNSSNVNGGGHVVMADKNRAHVGAIARTYIKGPRRADTSGNGGWQNLRSPSVPTTVPNLAGLQFSNRMPRLIAQRAFADSLEPGPRFLRAPTSAYRPQGGRLHILGDPESICLSSYVRTTA